MRFDLYSSKYKLKFGYNDLKYFRCGINMNIVDIYGHIPDKSKIIIGVGNYNNIHGLLTYFPHNDLLQIRQLNDIILPSVLILTLNYEFHFSKNKCHFSLMVEDNKYINVNVESIGNQKVAYACISNQKAIFWLDFSSIDKIPRNQILASSLYALQTRIDDDNYVVKWKIQGFANAELIKFLPINWYERDNIGNCVNKESMHDLIENLEQLQFKGYSTESWCDKVPYVVNCIESELCGKCLGPCKNPNHICYPSDGKFICGSPQSEPNLIDTILITMATTETNDSNNSSMGIWIAIIIIFILVALLTWILSTGL
jgi:hypothetical protein